MAAPGETDDLHSDLVWGHVSYWVLAQCTPIYFAIPDPILVMLPSQICYVPMFRTCCCFPFAWCTVEMSIQGVMAPKMMEDVTNRHNCD